MQYRRYAIYYTPPQGSMAEFGASWLGWDAAAGIEVSPPDVPGLNPAEIAAITNTPRKYGFHGTLKAPFRLAGGTTPDALTAAVAALATRLEPVTLDGLVPARLGGFLALVPEGDASALSDLAARIVTDLDAFRAPSSDADLARRRKSGLSERQEANLVTWGYPYVMEDFRFHMTLTGRLEANTRVRVAGVLETLLPPLLSRPYVIDAITLSGEGEDGRFRSLHRYPLAP